MRSVFFKAGLRFSGPPRLNTQYEDFLMWKSLALATNILGTQQPTAIYRVHSQSFTAGFHATKSLHDHLDGLAEVDSILLGDFSLPLQALQWTQRIKTNLDQQYLSAAAKIPVRLLPRNALACWNRGIFLQFSLTLARRAYQYANHISAAVVRKAERLRNGLVG